MTRVDPLITPQGKLSHDVPHILLRLLETTDVHANLLPFDYFAHGSAPHYGLARTATLIRQARQEAPNCVLLDNGDFLQGTPLSDMTAQPGSGWRGLHPSITAMNLLKYDAATLGNHEFNFGLDWLDAALRDARFPTVCANALLRPGESGDAEQTLLPPFEILHRKMRDSAGQVHSLRIGVLGLVPPQITTWDHFHLHDHLITRDIVETARQRVPQMRALGADIVVALAHTGIDPDDDYPLKENVAIALGRVPGIDAILAGHTHEVFPAADGADIEGVDNRAGTLGGTPAVMAGFRGSHLGVLDLYLQHDNATGWCVRHHTAEARAVAPAQGHTLVPAEPAIVRHLKPAHEHTLALVDRPIGRTIAPLHSYLAMVRNDPATQLITRVQHDALAESLQGSAFADLPILSASAPFKTGGRGGPGYFTDVPAGDLHLRNAADLYPFPNTLCGILLSGAELHDWLERAATCFNQILSGGTDQMLCNPAVPGHNFDIIHGLTYTIDLGQPARYDRNGRLRNGNHQRIHDLCHDGQPVTESARFIMAANSFRAYGGGPYPQLPAANIIATNRVPIRDIIAQQISLRGALTHSVDPVWTFAPMPGTQVLFDTGPGIRAYPQDLAALHATDRGTTPGGFARFSLPL